MGSEMDPAAQAVLELLYYRLRHYVCTLQLSEDAVARVDEVVGQLTSILAPSVKIILADNEKLKKEVHSGIKKEFQEEEQRGTWRHTTSPTRGSQYVAQEAYR